MDFGNILLHFSYIGRFVILFLVRSIILETKFLNIMILQQYSYVKVKPIPHKRIIFTAK